MIDCSVLFIWNYTTGSVVVIFQRSYPLRSDPLSRSFVPSVHPFVPMRRFSNAMCACGAPAGDEVSGECATCYRENGEEEARYLAEEAEMEAFLEGAHCSLGCCKRDDWSTPCYCMLYANLRNYGEHDTISGRPTAGFEYCDCDACALDYCEVCGLVAFHEELDKHRCPMILDAHQYPRISDPDPNLDPNLDQNLGQCGNCIEYGAPCGTCFTKQYKHNKRLRMEQAGKRARRRLGVDSELDD